MPTFCRHNRLIQNCPICAREQEVALRPVVTPGGRPEPAPRAPRTARPASGSPRPARAARGAARGLTVRRLVRAAEDGYASPLVPGVRSVADAERLAAELGFAATRLQVLATAPPGSYAEVADPAGELEERTWLAFQIAWQSPLEGAEDPFAGIERARVSWASGQTPEFAAGEPGPRAGGDAALGVRTSEAYRAWAGRLGSQASGISGEPSWTPERRFDRAFERLGALASMARDARYELLVTLGRLGVHELRGARLHLGGPGPVTLAAKRILGIGDPLLLERRAAELADACALPLEALDLGFFNWERGIRFPGGLPGELPADPDAVATARVALGLV